MLFVYHINIIAYTFCYCFLINAVEKFPTEITKDKQLLFLTFKLDFIRKLVSLSSFTLFKSMCQRYIFVMIT